MTPIAIDTSLLTAFSAAAAAAAGLVVAAMDWRHRGRSSIQDLAGRTVIKTVELEALPRPGLDSLFIVVGKSSESSTWGELERAIGGGNASQVVKSLSDADVFVLGQAAAHITKGTPSPRSELLHFEVESTKRSLMFLPVFTRPDALRNALREHPDWQRQSILELKGDELLTGRSEEVWLVIDPWSPREFELPPKTSGAEGPTED
jgi:hypothetical protein